MSWNCSSRTWLLAWLSLLVATVMAGLHGAQAPVAVQHRLQIRHAAPAQNWMQADPLGNGSLGAMVEGGVREERIWLNDDTLWSGEPGPPHRNDACLNNLALVRELIFAGREAEAAKLADQTMLGIYNQCAQPLGSLHLDFPFDEEHLPGDYARTLDLTNATHLTRFSKDEIEYRREIIASHPDQVLAIRLTASQPGAISLTARLDSLVRHRIVGLEDSLLLTGRAPIHADPHYQGTRIEYDSGEEPRGMSFAVELRALPEGGKCRVTEGVLSLQGCNAVTLLLSTSTSYSGFDRSPSREGRDAVAEARRLLDAAAGSDFAALRDRHVEDYRELFDRVSLDLGADDAAALFIEERIGPGHAPGKDPALAALFYQFGRYLLISSSREGTQPAHLQGIWTRKLNPSWSANWTVNCNAQFNYLGIGPAALAELAEPYLRLVEEAAVDGARVAQSWYGAPGWVVHHNLDLWRAAMPVDGNSLWAVFPCGGTWMTVQLFDLWRFTNERELLDRLWPLLRGSSEFWLAHLVEDPRTGSLVSCPDVYFENSFTKPDGSGGHLCAGPVSSTMMIRQLFEDTLEAATARGVPDAILERIRRTLPRLPQLTVGEDGEIDQWEVGGDWRESDPSQLLVMWGAIFADQIHPLRTPELANALALMLERRKWWVDGQGSWRAAFPAATLARLGDGDGTLEVFDAMIRTWANPNLSMRFIQSEWEIDGNLGMMAGIQECLLQSHAGEVELLPALPAAWSQSGAVRGLRARGNLTFDFRWKDGQVTEWRASSPSPAPIQLRVNGEVREVLPDRKR